MSQIRRLGQVEFIALVAVLFASIAFSVDTMLPGMSDIGAELAPHAPNNAQYVITAFVLGMGFGTLIVGPISDSFGRKRVIGYFAILYFGGAIISYRAGSMDVMIWGRVLMGIGAAGPRAVGLAIVRDLYSGREMARIMSFAMMVFSLVPAVGPLFGAFIIDWWGWREIFLGFIGFMVFAITWLFVRQPETLPPERRKGLRFSVLARGFVEVITNRVALVAIIVLALSFGMLFATLVSIQPVFDIVFDRNETFPNWFFASAILAMSSSFINARLVVRLGMRKLITAAYAGQIVYSGVMGLVTLAGWWPEGVYFWVYWIWATSIFWVIGFTIGNLNALALEPMGHIAGLAASVVSAAATVLGIVLAAPIGLAFDGTPVPAMMGVAVFALIGFLLMKWAMPPISAPD